MCLLFFPTSCQRSLRLSAYDDWLRGGRGSYQCCGQIWPVSYFYFWKDGFIQYSQLKREGVKWLNLIWKEKHIFIVPCAVVRTPLMLAALGGHTDCVHFLLEKGALPDAKDKRGSTALHRGVRPNHTYCTAAAQLDEPAQNWLMDYVQTLKNRGKKNSTSSLNVFLYSHIDNQEAYLKIYLIKLNCIDSM